MSAPAGWYPDPGGGQDLYRYWDGRAWSAATSLHPGAPAPAQGLVAPAPPAALPLGSQPAAAHPAGGQPYGAGQGARPSGQPGAGPGPGPAAAGQPYATATGSAYAQYQQLPRRRSPVGWWLAAAAVLVVVVVVAVVAVRALTGAVDGAAPVPGGQGSQNACPAPVPNTTATPDPQDGRVHGGPVSMPLLGPPWSAPKPEVRVPFGTDAKTQTVLDQASYGGVRGQDWVASVLVAELQAGDGFFSPEQGSQIVVRCILGKFYGNSVVRSDVKVNEQATIDGHDAWVVESQLSFDIPGLQAKGERLIVAIVSAGATSGLYYASVPDTQPDLVAPARRALADLQVDG